MDLELERAKRAAEPTSCQTAGAAEGKLAKYYRKAKRLLPVARNNRFLIDEESWYSITPRGLADAISASARRGYGPCRVLDLFAGVGGNTISFLNHGHAVDSVEYDPLKVGYLEHNVAECVEVPRQHRVVAGDVFASETVGRLADSYELLMASPPWGGLDYLKLSPAEMLLQCRLLELEEIYGDRARTRVYFVPRTLSPRLMGRLFNCEMFPAKSGHHFIGYLAVMGEVAGFAAVAGDGGNGSAGGQVAGNH